MDEQKNVSKVNIVNTKEEIQGLIAMLSARDPDALSLGLHLLQSIDVVRFNRRQQLLLYGELNNVSFNYPLNDAAKKGIRSLKSKIRGLNPHIYHVW